MQVPSTINGLRQSLLSLGFGDVLTGLDSSDPQAKDHCRQQIKWLYSQGKQTLLDQERCRSALSLVEQFGWGEQGDEALASVLDALGELHALLEEEQLLEPVDVEEYVEDEDGDVSSIVINLPEDAIEAALAAVEAALVDFIPKSLLEPIDLGFDLNTVKKLWQGTSSDTLEWADTAPGSEEWEEREPVVVVAQDGTWYGPYPNRAVATRSAKRIAAKGDNHRRRVPLAKLRMLRKRDWAPALSSFGTNSRHRTAARKN